LYSFFFGTDPHQSLLPKNPSIKKDAVVFYRLLCQSDAY